MREKKGESGREQKYARERERGEIYEREKARRVRGETRGEMRDMRERL